MALKRDEYYWIEGANGKLADVGRVFELNTIFEMGTPHLFLTKRDAREYCRPGEKPVKVRLGKVEDQYMDLFIIFLTICIFFYGTSTFIIGVKRDTERIEKKIDELLGHGEREEDK